MWNTILKNFSLNLWLYLLDSAYIIFLSSWKNFVIREKFPAFSYLLKLSDANIFTLSVYAQGTLEV